MMNHNVAPSPLAMRERLLHERNALSRLMMSRQDLRLQAETESDRVPSSAHQEEDTVIDLLAAQVIAIDDALASVDAGTYGICDACGTPIPPKRLDAYPAATMCVRCRSAMEGAHHR